MDSATRAVVERLNPWLLDPGRFHDETRRYLPQPFIPRRVGSAVRSALEHDHRAHLVIGPRQAGKSSLVWSLLHDGPASVLYVNCEEPIVRNWCTSPALFVADVEGLLPPGGRIFLEEAQWLPEAGLFLKGVVDARRRWPVMVTGSSSFHLMAKTRESLAGRATRHHLFPLSLDEVAASALPGVLQMRRRAAVDRMLVHGGYPEAWTHTDPQRVLRELVEAFIVRDASDRFRIERPDAFRRLLHLAAGQVGDLVRMAEWAALLGIAGTTVADYLGILEETHVVRMIRPYIGGRRAELTKAPKVFFVDNGLRNALAGGFLPLDQRADVGKLMENLVFSELHKRWAWPGDVRYWRSKNGAEVDFILEPEPGRLVAVEVKAAARGRLSRSARSFVRAYQPSQLLLVHRGETGEERLGDTRVRQVPLELLPEVLEEL